MKQVIVEVVRHGDCLDELKKFRDNSVDSLVTDPPAGISFMGKDWDSDKGGPKQWIAWMSEVMRYLIRMVTPPGGTVLDPFAGSGSTGVAAVSEGFEFIGIEREAEYVEIARKRVFNAFPKAEKQYAKRRRK